MVQGIRLDMEMEKEKEREMETETETERETKTDWGELSNSMEAAIYRAAIAGDTNGLTTALHKDLELNLLNQLTPQDDTILHIAARLGHHHLAEHIQSNWPDLFKSKNYNNDYPLHLAAAGGHLSIVQSLIPIASGHLPGRETEAEQEALKRSDWHWHPQYGGTPSTPTSTSTWGAVEQGKVKKKKKKKKRKNFNQSLATTSLEVTESPSKLGFQSIFEALNVIKWQNKQGNTPLHMAVKDHQYDVALFLFTWPRNLLTSCVPNLEKKSPLYTAAEGSLLTSCVLNLEQKSPLYLAAESGHQELFELMIQFVASNVVAQNMLKNGQPLLHVAITRRNMVVLKTALKCVPSLMDAHDRRGRRPLSYAASIGYVDGVCYIMKKFGDCTYKRDSNGSYPIHEASSQGHIEVVKKFVERFPDSKELLNGQGQNILHVAAKSGKANIVSYILKTPELEMLINDTDQDGNTPLLLATKKANAEIVSILTWDKRVRLEIENGEDFTALDAALKYRGTTCSIRQRLTWMALRYASAPRGQPKTIKTEKNSNSCIGKTFVQSFRAWMLCHSASFVVN